MTEETLFHEALAKPAAERGFFGRLLRPLPRALLILQLRLDHLAALLIGGELTLRLVELGL